MSAAPRPDHACDVVCQFDADGVVVGATLAGRMVARAETVTFDNVDQAAAFISDCVRGDSTHTETREGKEPEPALCLARVEEISERASGTGTVSRKAKPKKTKDRYYSMDPKAVSKLKMTRAEWAVVLYLMDRSDRFGTAKAVQSIMADELGASKQHVSVAVTRLAKLGVFDVTVNRLNVRCYRFGPALFWNYTLDERNRRIGRDPDGGTTPMRPDLERRIEASLLA